MRRCVADSGYFLLWRPGFGARRHRRRIRHGRRCEPEHGRAGDRPQPKLCRINLCRWCGRFPEDHGHRRDRRGGHPARGIEQSDQRLAGPMLRCGKQGIKTAANHLTRGDTGRGNSVARATRWPSQGSPIAQRRMWPKIKLCAIVLLGR
jgi:hypothetical protein